MSSDELRQNLQTMAATWALFADMKGSKPSPMERMEGLIARAGTAFGSTTPTPAQLAFLQAYRPDELPIKQCFMNSQRMLLSAATRGVLSGAGRHRLTYYEGYAYAGMIPFHHGWLVLDDTVLVDLTLTPDRDKPRDNRLASRVIGQLPPDWGYVGVPFTLAEVLTFTLETGLYGSLLDDYPRKWPFLQKSKERWPNAGGTTPAKEA